MKLKNKVLDIQNDFDQERDDSYQFGSSRNSSYMDRLRKIVEKHVASLDPLEQNRIQLEFFNHGPLEEVLQDADICEILVNGPQDIWYEKNGQLQKLPDEFLSPVTYRNILDRICHSAQVHPTAEHPIVDGQWGPFRINFVRSEVHPLYDIFSLRRHPDNPWTLEALCSSGWCTFQEQQIVLAWIQQGKNFLVVGPTSSGKTSVLNACLNETGPTERTVILEDSSEIKISNLASIKLLTRKDTQGLLPDVTLSDLLRTALRLRPDRLVIGEMRGAEAKDFLMALSSGHKGSLSSLHAESAAQALLRLEMLVQLGAPQWSLQAIRRLIHLSLDGILVTGRNAQGRRSFQGLYSISSLEETGFTLEKLGPSEFSTTSSDKLRSLPLSKF